MDKVNYQKELDKLLSDENNRGKRLFLHSCCAPCSSYVLTYLSPFFDITVFYYNPNITDDEEYFHRVEEQKRLISTLNDEIMESGTSRFPIDIVEGTYDVKEYYTAVCGLENEPEGGARCDKCFSLRLNETARLAALNGADFFGTTLTISPMKNAQLINAIGLEIEKSAAFFNKLRWLPSDFKKKEGYRQSIELSKKYELYRQDYCGCEFSKRERYEKIY